MEICMRAFAKLNLHLAVTGRREDGYHLLDTLMQSVDLADELILRPSEEIALDCPEFPGPQNLAWRAAELLRLETGCDKGVSITLVKHIPAGAGMGGGSADAAAVLRGCCRLWGIQIPEEKLKRLALRLGADIPFQLTGGLCRCTGTGEIMHPMPPLPDYPMLAVFPGTGVSTKDAYAQWDRSEDPQPHTQAAMKCLENGQWEKAWRSMGNGLEAAACRLHPELLEVRTALAMTAPLTVSMTGSGSAFYAVYVDAAHRDAAMQRIGGVSPAWTLFAMHMRSSSYIFD